MYNVTGLKILKATEPPIVVMGIVRSELDCMSFNMATIAIRGWTLLVSEACLDVSLCERL